MTSLSFERIPILESSRKRGLPPNLHTNKGKSSPPAGRAGALFVRGKSSAPSVRGKFENRRFSYTQPGRARIYLDIYPLFGSGSAKLGDGR